MSRDCTSPYKLDFKQKTTVGNFLQEIIDNHAEDWGTIRIFKKNVERWEMPQIRYKYGEILSVDPIFKKYKDKVIKSATADGGWTLMDYVLYL